MLEENEAATAASNEKLQALLARLPGGGDTNSPALLIDFFASEYYWGLDQIAGLDHRQTVAFIEQALRRKEATRQDAGMVPSDSGEPRVVLQITDNTRQPDPPTETLDDNQYTVLRALRDMRPRQVLLVELATETKIGGKTCGKVVKSLIDRGLAERPSERKGVTITQSGIRLLDAAAAPPQPPSR
jgi:hypothetical protein